MRLGIGLLALGGALVAAYPLSMGPVEIVEPVSSDLLQDIYTFAAFTRAAYCAANHDGTIGNLVCSNNANAGACDVFAGATTIVELTDSAEVAGNVVVSHARRLVVVSFRGSHRWSDVWRNIQVLRVDAPALCADCSVHRGYWNVFLNIRDRLAGALLGEGRLAGPGYRVVLTGHSMGGALAAISAAYLRSRGRSCDLFTYGAPHVGNQALADLIGGPGGVTAHVVNGEDPIASQPPRSIGYASVVPEYWFEAGIEKPAFPDNLRVCDGVNKKSDECSAKVGGWLPVFTGGLSDHSIDAYSNRSMPCPGE
ncbi:lipase (class 3) domain-containing protein [Hirsutella rhossiliensis]|uniref:Lipase (Class 3) domain-containing protein n=1 Tax=Hirsutella rhossiliensis TaxID=111463 RepID=A0A9P8SHH0_9HYPO|nr:lipase (class 3) domain-containing protein [Hirsutella rhossiliensis]KAH0962164.1 lipase (class 3) domain-containing protein [Hirsutella rhossiliensis]